MIQAELLNNDEGIETYGVVLREKHETQILYRGLKFEVLAFLCGVLGPVYLA
jgi:hypothetical protein